MACPSTRSVAMSRGYVISILLIGYACGASGGSSQATVEPTPASEPRRSVDAGVVDASERSTNIEDASATTEDAAAATCIVDEKAKAACLAEGELFRYGERPKTDSCERAFGANSLEAGSSPRSNEQFSCVCMMNDACVYDRAAAGRCADKGANFFYGPAVFVYCKGAAPRPGEMQCQRERTRSASCACNDRAALDRRRQRCSMIP